MVPRPRRRPPPLLAVLLLATTGGLAAQGAPDLERTLEQVQGLVATHRYQGVLEALAPFVGADLEAESRYAVAAELGRAHYHLGRYAEARVWFERAVSTHPDRLETVLYLAGSSYLSDRREQALAIVRQVLAAGATDLYLLVTLAGERAFLRDGEVQKILDQHARPLPVSLVEGRFGAVRLGDQRVSVERALGAPAGAAASGVLIARAGPSLVWALAFTADGALAQVTVDADRLLRYTPFRLRLDHGLDWRVTAPAAATLLGPPASQAEDGDLELLTWRTDRVALTLGFGPPLPPPPPPLTSDSTMLRVLVLADVAAGREGGPQGDDPGGGRGPSQAGAAPGAPRPAHRGENPW